MRLQDDACRHYCSESVMHIMFCRHDVIQGTKYMYNCGDAYLGSGLLVRDGNQCANFAMKVLVDLSDCKCLSKLTLLMSWDILLGLHCYLLGNSLTSYALYSPHYHGMMVVSMVQYLLPLLAQFLHPCTLLPLSYQIPLLSTMYQYLLYQKLFHLQISISPKVRMMNTCNVKHYLHRQGRTQDI